MAFPRNINPATPAGTDLISLGDDQIRTLKQDLLDLFGIPSATNMTAAIMDVNTDGTLAALAEIQGLVTINRGTSSLNALLLGMAQPAGAGTRDSHDITWRGTSFDTAGHNADWKAFVDVTANDGTSRLTIQSRIDAASYATRFALGDNGDILPKREISWASGVGSGIIRTVDNPSNLDFYTANAFRVRINENGILFINATANGNMTTGLTIDQGVADNQILALRSADVAHGLTTSGLHEQETTDFATFQKVSPETGGLTIQATAETGLKTGMQVFAVAGQPDVVPGSGSDALVQMFGVVHNGANTLISPDANSLIFSVGTSKVAGFQRIFFIDVDGDLHVDGSTSLTTFDDHDDVALLTGLRAMTMPPCDFRERFAAHIAQAKDILHQGRVITYNSPTDIFVSYKGLQGLIIDAIRQLATRLDHLEGTH